MAITSKVDIKREKVLDPCLRQIILRLDYAGVSDVVDLVKIFEKKFPSDFRSKDEVYSRNYAIRKEDLREISETLSVPVKVIEDERIIRYSGLKNVNGNTTLDISRYFICMTIDIDPNVQYEGLSNYVDKFKGAITGFKENIIYFSPRRLGLRKIRVENLNSLEDANHTFESFVYPNPCFGLSQPTTNKVVYFNHLADNDHEHLRYNLRREFGMVQKPEGTPNGYQFILDIDAYYNDAVTLNSKKINDLITLANLQEFELYVACMTFDYLKTHLRQS